MPAQEPKFSDFSEVARLAKYLGVFDQQTLNLLFGLSGGLIFCSEDLCHHFTPCSRPIKPRFWLPRTTPTTLIRGTLPRCPSSLTQRCCCTPPRWENTTFYPFLHRNHPTYTKPLYPSPSSPQMMQLLNEFLISKCPAPGQPLTPKCTRPCSSSHPSQEKLHTLKTPSRARLRSLHLLHTEPPLFCVATPLVK